MLDGIGSPSSRSGETPEHPAPLFGRTEVLESLVRVLESARGDRARFVLISGEGGVGKSTMLRAAVASARSVGFQVLAGRALPSDLPQPFRLIQDLVRSAQQERSLRQSAQQGPASMLPLFIAPYDSDGAAEAAVSGYGTGAPEVGEADRLLIHLSNPSERIDADRNSLFNRLSDFFLQWAEKAPLMVAIDDLQFADDSSLEFLARFLSQIGGHRIALVATLTPEEDAAAPVTDAFAEILRSPLAETLTIRRMTELELAQYVRWILHDRDPGPDAVMRWFTQTEGNPLFVEHLVRGSRGFDSGVAARTETPGALHEVLRQRVRELPEPERRVLVYGAVLGKEFDFPTLARACGGEEERLSESLDHLVHGGVLREKGGEVYEFVSERTRTDVYSELTETRRRILHGKAARAIESTPDSTTNRVYELARQYYLGRDDAKAVEFNRRAADLAIEAFAFETAVTSLERALEAVRRLVPRDFTVELRLLVELGRVLGELGDLRRSEEVLLDAVARARVDAKRETELSLALLGLAQTRSDLAMFTSARSLATEAFSILEKLQHTRGLLAAHRVLGVAAWRMGDLPTAVHHQREELAIAEVEGTPTQRGHAMIDLANTFILQGEKGVPEALGLYEKAAAIFAAGQDHSAHSRVLMNRAVLHHNAGRMEEAVADMEGALRAAERSRSRIWIGYCSLNMAQFRVELHDPDEARRMLTKAAGLLEPLGDQLAHQQSVMIDGMIDEERGEFSGAEEKFGRALGLARELALTAETAEMLYRMSKLAHHRGDRIEARRRLQEAREAGIATLRGDLTAQIRELDGQIGEAAPQR
ncbi:MAG: AAA family ATPase [Thermoplasmata archaeon]|nr:AAA family ATPase [Thermoplasmata archaeon]